MSSKEILREAMALPLGERVALAQTLWQSIEGQPSGNVSEEVAWAVAEADRRDGQLSSGQASGRTHEQVMRAARNAIE
jgi:putative addiction module component (TIGR02574 family)